MKSGSIPQFPLRRQKKTPCFVWYLLGILPFLSGGFHTASALITVPVLLYGLIQVYRTQGFLSIGFTVHSITCLAIALGYFLTPLWAADRGMAPFGIVRFLPLLLLTLLLMQYTREEKMTFLQLLPYCGAAMVLLSCICLLLPAIRDYVTVNGRLAGFLQYPNSFAAFLLAGFSLQSTKKDHRFLDWLADLLLVTGIFLSGSRTCVLILFFTLFAAAVFHKKIPLSAGVGIAVFVCISGILLIRTENQITFLGRDIGSLFVRILYYKDAVPVILRHPFGLGYLGYRALETTFHTSRYTVRFVHSGLLQLLLDIGWIPALLVLVSGYKAAVSSRIPAPGKMLLLILSVHCIVDFDLQFFLFWAILLLCLDFESEKTYHLTFPKQIRAAAIALVLGIGFWLGSAELLHQTGMHHAALKITPFHTDALASVLMETENPEKMDLLADQILAKNPANALAYSAKANAAYARGQVPEMIHYKETALDLTPYTTAEYCDYIEKLYTVLEVYVRNADTESAAYCLKKILSVPDRMEAVAASTDPLAYKTGNDTALLLPEPYQKLITELMLANPTILQQG